MNNISSMDQLFLEKVHSSIDKNFSNQFFNVDHLAREIGISRYQLNRRLKVISGQSPSQMIKEFRLQKAFELLQIRLWTISEIAYQVGFSSPSYFTACFKKHFGYPPGKVKRIKYSGVAQKYSISKKLLFNTLAIMVVVVSVFVVHIIVSKGNIESSKTAITHKSIAVLPFKSLSPDPDKQYLADGVMDAILLQLSKIEDLKVIDRTSVEQYRETDKTATAICHELDVAYILEGSFQKYGDQARLILQLIEPGKEGHIWAKEYDRNWTDIFSVQSEVAQAIARELHAVITPEEKQLIEKIPTYNREALYYYQRGREEYKEYSSNTMKQEISYPVQKPIVKTDALERAVKNYRQALRCDSAYAQVYVELGWVYWVKHYWNTFLTENYLDSVLILADKALSFDDQLADAYVLKGVYYRIKDKRQQAINEFDKAIKYNPNEWRAYRYKGWVYIHYDLVQAIDNLHKAASLHKGTNLPEIWGMIGDAYGIAGFKEKSILYAKKSLDLDKDSAAYYSSLATLEHLNRNYDRAIDYGEKSYAIDSTGLWVIYLLGLNHMWLGHAEESLEYMQKYDRRLGTQDRPFPHRNYRIGYAYWMNGFQENAEHYFITSLENIQKMIDLSQNYVSDFHLFFNLAAIYAFQGDKDKAFENLRLLNQRQRMPIWMVSNIKDDPMFDSIRDEPEFQQIVQDIETKYQAEHERVRQWLEENDTL